MSNGVNPKEDDRLEELESLISLLSEIVENFKKETTHTNQQLHEFMSEYINLEDKILEKFDLISNMKDVDSNQMNQLTDKFNENWGDFQDTWEKESWDVYYTYRGIKDKNLNNGQMKKGGHLFEDSFEDNDEIMNISLGQKFQPKEHIKTRGGSSNEDTMNVTTVNINKIDEELKEVGEMSICREKKEEKKRGCLDCVIF
jgi:hypothetical protein